MNAAYTLQLKNNKPAIFKRSAKVVVPLFILLLILLFSVNVFIGIYFTLLFIAFAIFIIWFVKQSTFALFFEDKIILQNKMYKRTIEWTSLYNVVLKDGLLTLDFKNDKLIQEEVVFYENVDGINEFLKLQTGQ